MTLTPDDRASVIAMARASMLLTEQFRVDAVRRGDFATAIRTANSEAVIESRLRDMGIELEDVLP